MDTLPILPPPNSTLLSPLFFLPNLHKFMLKMCICIHLCILQPLISLSSFLPPSLLLPPLHLTAQLDVAIDGADEVDPQLTLIKGGG